MKEHPFIGAEKVAGHSANNACRPLEVLRHVFHSRSSNPSSKRAVTDVEIFEQIRPIHAESKAPMDG